MDSDDDDDVPPLEGMQQQLGALKVSQPERHLAVGDADSLPVATATVVAQKPRSKAAAGGKGGPAIRRGFFDSPKQKATKPTRKSVAEDIPVLRGTAAGTSGKQIPDFLRVDQSESEEQMKRVKEGLVSALKPSEDTVQEIMKDPDLLAGFDDPEVMAAVDEIAKNPQAIKKYQHNAKVQKFYSAMGMFVGNRLEGMDAAGGGKQ